MSGQQVAELSYGVGAGMSSSRLMVDEQEWKPSTRRNREGRTRNGA